LFIKAQLHGTSEQRKKFVLDAITKAEMAAETMAKRARDCRVGNEWLLANNVSLENVLFYEHSGRFSFGWSKPITGKLLVAWKALLADFPAPYEIIEKK
jgi:hypothetical protein